MAGKGEIRNARIKSTFLGVEDHGCFTFFVHVRYDDSHGEQGFGGRLISERSDLAGMIRQITEIAGVMTWEELPGKFIRVRSDRERIYAIGHILEDRWYDPDEERGERDG